MRSPRETIGERTRTHGMTNTRLYSVWCGMKNRCNNPNVRHFPEYGGRGIKVAKVWEKSFLEFYKWSVENGYDENLRGREQSIDRVDPDGDYCPENCRWLSMRQQARNRRDTVYLRYNGGNVTARAFAEENGITSYVFVYRRAKKGQTGETIKEAWESRRIKTK